jgi:hypothetical protein
MLPHRLPVGRVEILMEISFPTTQKLKLFWWLCLPKLDVIPSRPGISSSPSLSSEFLMMGKFFEYL